MSSDSALSLMQSFNLNNHSFSAKSNLAFMNRATLSMRTPRQRASQRAEGRIAKERLKYLASCRTKSAVSQLGFLGKKAADEMVENCKTKLYNMASIAIQV